MGQTVTGNWLNGLLSFHEITHRFPFLKSLRNQWSTRSCGSCGDKAIARNTGNQINEVAKILASIPEDEIEVFKQMTKVSQLHITYIDTRGQQQMVSR